MRPLLKVISLLTLSMSGLSAAYGGSFSVSPIKVELAGDQRASTITIRNDSGAPITIQVDPTEWSQREGEDVLAATKEIVAGPPIFKLGPGEEQIVRVGRLIGPVQDSEKAYRLLLREVPEAATRGLAVALRISLPIFVTPKTKIAPQLSFEWLKDAAGVHLRARNTGSQHIRVAGFTAELADDPVNQVHHAEAFYVLAGTYRDFPLGTARAPQAARVRAMIDGVETEFAVPAL